MLQKNQTKLIVIALLSLAIVSLSLVAMRLLSYESVTADKAQEKITLEENASKYKSTKISSKNITLPGWRELSLSVDSSLEARGIDFYNTYEDDIDLMHELGINAFRFSISWTRLFPTGEEDIPDAEGIEFYRKIVKKL